MLRSDLEASLCRENTRLPGVVGQDFVLLSKLAHQMHYISYVVWSVAVCKAWASWRLFEHILVGYSIPRFLSIPLSTQASQLACQLLLSSSCYFVVRGTSEVRQIDK